jgi:dTDP-4-amino-4,6-dideoxygalactose transaminase
VRAQIEKTLVDNPPEEGAWLFRYYGKNPSKVAELEKEFTATSGAGYALATNSCTSALIAALVACGVGPGDDVIVPGYTFIATATAAVMAGAVPIIAEVDESLTLDPEDIEGKITPHTKAIMPVHMRGLPANMEAIMAVARAHNLKVIEDVAQACGGSYHGQWLGTFGDMGCFSFDQYKIMASGEGGMIITNDEYLYTRAQSYHDTAACWRPNRFAREQRPGELFAGENYRLSEIQGAVALAQLRKLQGYIQGCREAKWRLTDELRQAGIAPMRIGPVHDPEGDAAQTLTLMAPSGPFAKELIARLQAKKVVAGGIYDKTVRDWHIYPYWEYIMERKTPTAAGHPYSAYEGKLPDYSASMCPRTIEILEKTVYIGVAAGLPADKAHAIATEVARTVKDINREGIPS